MKLEINAILTLAAHEHCLQKISQLTKEIGVHLNKCENYYRVIGPRPEGIDADMPWPNGSHEHMRALYDKDGHGNRKTHIWDAFQERIELNIADFGGERRLTDEEIADYLLERGCVHCTRAWWFVRERKRVKNNLRGFRISIRALGKSAIKALEPGR